jgi:hypothetical protein
MTALVIGGLVIATVGGMWAVLDLVAAQLRIWREGEPYDQGESRG